LPTGPPQVSERQTATAPLATRTCGLKSHCSGWCGFEQEHRRRRAAAPPPDWLDASRSRIGRAAGLCSSPTSAISARSAWPVGYASNCSKTLILRWNGTAWK